jgi:hypothetical protein
MSLEKRFIAKSEETTIAKEDRREKIFELNQIWTPCHIAEDLVEKIFLLTVLLQGQMQYQNTF